MKCNTVVNVSPQSIHVGSWASVTNLTPGLLPELEEKHGESSLLSQSILKRHKRLCSSFLCSFIFIEFSHKFFTVLCVLISMLLSYKISTFL